MVAGFNGAYFGASSDWNWDDDFAKQSLSLWANEPLGLPGPPQMLDKEGCGWTRKFASGAHVYVNLCFGKGHPMSAHAVWADNSTWPAKLGHEAAAAIVAAHPVHHHYTVANNSTSVGAEVDDANRHSVGFRSDGTGVAVDDGVAVPPTLKSRRFKVVGVDAPLRSKKGGGVPHCTSSGGMLVLGPGGTGWGCLVRK
jgi:hypothetical protein